MEILFEVLGALFFLLIGICGCIYGLTNDLKKSSIEDNSITLKHGFDGIYTLIHKGQEWHYSSFSEAMRHMDSLRRPPTGDPK